MIKNHSVISIIPARGGSKGLPEKSIIDLCGKPLIAYSIDASKESQYIDRTIVSTDSNKMARIANKCGAEVPFLRPTELATDTASSMSVILHTLEFLKNQEAFIPDITIILQPTSPLRTSIDIDTALEMFISSDADNLMSVYKPEVSPFWFREIDDNGYLQEFIHNDSPYIRRQDTNKLLMLNGAIYIYYSKNLLLGTIKERPKTLAYIMPAKRSIDIDSEMDLKLAEVIIKGA